MYQKGQRFYGAALTQLQKWLLDPQEARKNDVLTSVLCLCLYEHVVLSEETAWLKHYEGIARLVEHRGPGSFQTKFERDVFQLCRCMIVSSSARNPAQVLTICVDKSGRRHKVPLLLGTE